LGKDGGSRLTPVVENRDRFKLFGVGVFAISPPEWRGAAAAAAAGEGVPPSSRSRAPPGSSRAPPGKAEAECVEESLRNLGDVLVDTRPERPPPGRRRAAAAAREGVPPSSPSRAPPGKAECVEGSLSNLGDVLGTRPDRAARALGEDMVVVVFLCCRY
jgi:hypothetical protein